MGTSIAHASNQPPRLEIPPPSPDFSFTAPSISMKSKIHALFHWRKSTGSSRPATRASNAPTERLNHFSQPALRPALSQRSLSARTEAARYEYDGKAGHPSAQRKDKIFMDPPPFAQVLPQALLRADLEIPASFTIRAPERDSRDISPRDPAEDIIEVKKSHKRSESGQSYCSTLRKSFCLVPGPYVLQYDNDCDGSSLPEKILILGRNSVVFASDAVPGRPWVLQVSQVKSSAKNGHPGLRPSWSRVTLRQTENKRSTRTLLLIFDDSEDMYTWLFAIRKEIENLGGLEYRPETRDDQSWRDDLNKKFGASTPDVSRKLTAQPSVKAQSRCSSPFTMPPKPITRDISGVRPNSNSSSLSSRHTSTSLDRLRDSVTSAGYSSTTANSTGDFSLGSKSPPRSAASSTFPSIPSIADRPNGGLLFRAYSEPSINGGNESTLSLNSPTTSILNRRKLSVGNLRISNPESIRNSKPVINVPSPISGSPNDNVLSHDPSPAVPRSPLSQQVSAHTELVESQEDVKNPGEHKRLASTVTSAQLKPQYSLFPAKEAKPDLPVSQAMVASPPRPPTSNRCVSAASTARPETRAASRASNKTVKNPRPSHETTHSRTVTLKLARHRYSTLLAVDDFENPQRSPAVTDDMIMFNFGASKEDPPRSPLPPTKVPDLTDLGFDLDFLRSPYKPPKKTSPLREGAKLTTSKSMNNMNGDATMMTAPAGPPPAGPLPAVPADSRRSSRTARSSQYSQYSQYSRNSRSSSQSRYSQYSQTGLEKHAPTKPPSAPKYTLFTQPDAIHVPEDKPKSSHQHKRTISNPLDGPPPPERASSINSPTESLHRSRSRSLKQV